MELDTETQNLSTTNENEREDFEVSLENLDIIDVKPEVCWPTDEGDSKDDIITTELKEDPTKRPKKTKGRKINIKDNRNKKNVITKEIKKKENPVTLKIIDTVKEHQETLEDISNSSNFSFNNIDNDNASDNDSYIVERHDASNPNKDILYDTKTKAKKHEFDSFIAEWKQDLECELCHENYNNFTLLRKHFASKHPQQKCYITCCQHKLTHRVQIVEHIRYHMDSNSFKCTICEKVFLNSRNLNTHMRDQHTTENKERPFECNLCQKRFFKKGALKSHMDTHDSATDFKCGKCGKGFPTEQRRKIHERTVHNVDRICEQCGKTLRGVTALKQHMLEHAGIKKRKWPCDQCNAELTSHFSLKRHKTIHDTTSKVYVCNECGKTATTQMGLQSHKKYVHQLERKFKCTICDKAFKVAHVLREHMATHTGEDLYKCPHCPQTFKVNANMHHHRKKVHPKEWAEARINKVTRFSSLMGIEDKLI